MGKRKHQHRPQLTTALHRLRVARRRRRPPSKKVKATSTSTHSIKDRKTSSIYKYTNTHNNNSSINQPCSHDKEKLLLLYNFEPLMIFTKITCFVNHYKLLAFKEIYDKVYCVAK